MIKPGMILIGAGGHSHACIDVVEQQNQFQIMGLIDLPEQIGVQHLDYSVIGSDTDLSKLVKIHMYALITIGQIKTAEHRIRLYRLVTQLGFKLPVITSPIAYVSRHASIGAGTIVMHGAVINAGAKVGNNCIINTHTLIEHDVIVNDNCHVSTGAKLNGGVSVGVGSFIGSGSIIKEDVIIGKSCMVGMGLSIRFNLSDNTNFTSCDKI